MPENDDSPSTERLAALRRAVGDGDAPIIVAIHDFPDPDALAAGYGLQQLLKFWNIDSVLAFEEGFGRTENARMAKALDIQWRRFGDLQPRSAYRGVILADTQPASSNHSLPPELRVLAVFDHHPPPPAGGGDNAAPDSARRQAVNATAADSYRDIRPRMGATSTLIDEYLNAAGVKPTKPLATALFLGIATDTDDLLRAGGPEDRAAYARLLPLVDLATVAVVRRAPLGTAYFDLLTVTLERARCYGGAVAVDCGPVPAPDLLSAMADLLIRAEGARWVLCLGHTDDGALSLSMRLATGEKHAARLMRRTLDGVGFGGGHALTAGGRIDPTPAGVLPVTATEVIERFVSMVGMSTQQPRRLNGQPA